MLIYSSPCPHITDHFGASPVTLFAAEELTRYFEKIFQNGKSATRLEVIFSLDETQAILNDGSSICINEDEIVISASKPTGILHGVYEVLRMIGCRFLFPDHEYVPTLCNLELENGKTLQNPVIEFRGLCLYHTTAQTLPQTLTAIDYMAKNGYNLLLTSISRHDDAVLGTHAILWNEIKDDVLPELVKRGILVDMSEHSTDYFFDRNKWFKLHPEWFSMIAGKRSPLQICFSNQAAIVEYAKAYVEFAETHHDFAILGTWPLDGGGYCECEGCKDPLAVYRANKYIANEISKVRPDLVVEHLAYTPQSFSRPNEKLPSNMSALVCSVKDTVAFEWGLKAKNGGGAFYFDYGTGDHYRFRSNLWINPFHSSDMVNTFYSYEYRGIISLYLPITATWQASLNYYYLSKLYYNPNADIEELTASLCIDLFGQKNAPVMTEAMMIIFKELQNQILWSGLPHKQDYFAEHITGRNRSIDRMHREKFESICKKLERLLATADLTDCDEFEKRQYELLCSYINLQWLYFTCCDQYDADCDTPQKAEPYFNELALLTQKYGSVFIPESYARWRIVGRDNIFNPKNANTYQPATE